MNTGSMSTHPSDDMWERYHMHMLTEDQCASMEEHLLICPLCQSSLEQVDEYVRVAKRAISGNVPRPPGHPTPVTTIAARLRSVPKPVWAGAVAALVLIAVLPSFRATEKPTEVTLRAFRGTESVSQAPAGAPIVLKIDTTEISRPRYKLEVADHLGNPVWNASVAPDANHIVIASPKRLPSGSYWIRLYDSAHTSTLLREYGLQLTPR